MRTLFLGLVLGAGFGTAAGAVGATPIAPPVAIPAPTPAIGAAAAAPSRAVRTPRAGRGGKATAPRATPAKSAPAPAAAPAVNKSGIVFVGANTWEVPEAIVDRYVSDPSALSGQAGATQVSNGWKLTSVKSGSRVAQMGLQSGDVITSVNGYGLGSLTSTWWASTHLKNEDLYRVSIRRGGSPQTLKYQVID